MKTPLALVVAILLVAGGWFWCHGRSSRGADATAAVAAAARSAHGVAPIWPGITPEVQAAFDRARDRFDTPGSTG